MKNEQGNRTLGVIILLLGVYLACRAVGLFHFNIFFAGWWTLFIIVPCTLGMIRDKSKGGSAVGLIIGVLLLLWQQDFINGSVIPAIMVAVFFVLIGLFIMVKQPKQNKQQEQHKSANSFKKESTSSSNFEACPPNISAILVGKSVNSLRGVFQGTNILTVLGNIQLDLRQAHLENDVYITVTMVLGGIDIYLPEGVNISNEASCILGEIRDVRPEEDRMVSYGPTIHITGSCILGGLEIK